MLRTRYELPQLMLVLQTMMALAGLLVALLAAVRFSVEGRRVDLLLAAGFLVTSLSAAAFAIGPRAAGQGLSPSAAWAALIGGILGRRSSPRLRSARWDAAGAATGRSSTRSTGARRRASSPPGGCCA